MRDDTPGKNVFTTVLKYDFTKNSVIQNEMVLLLAAKVTDILQYANELFVFLAILLFGNK